MENTSQVILRNRDRLGHGPVHLVDPAADGLADALATRQRVIRVSSSSHGDWSRLQAVGVDAHYEVVPAIDEQTELVIMVLPREKERLRMQLHAVASAMSPRSRLWLVGANRAGIKSCPKLLERYFKRIEKVDNARHCSLFEASGAQADSPFSLDAYERSWRAGCAGKQIELRSLPGVFAHGRLDAGTRLLLEVLEEVRPAGRVLDFASGSGVVGIAVQAIDENASVVLLDDSALAIESGRRSLAVNGFDAQCLPSNGLAELTGHFDWIVSNPPFHLGVENDLDVAAGFFRDAGTFLTENGRILVVFNRHLPYGRWLNESFNRVDCLAQNREFTVIQASKKK